MKNKSLFIASPIGHEPCMEYAISLAGTRELLKKSGVRFEHFFIQGCSDLAYARNLLAADFLASGCSDMLWIDADHGWDIGGPLRLLSSDKECIAALCMKRKDDAGFAVRFADGPPTKDGFFPGEKIGLGFTKIARSVFERVMAAHPELKRAEDHPNVANDDKPGLWRFFQFDGSGTGEDVQFFRIWRALGGSVWIDPTIRISHIGRKDYEWKPSRFQK